MRWISYTYIYMYIICTRFTLEPPYSYCILISVRKLRNFISMSFDMSSPSYWLICRHLGYFISCDYLTQHQNYPHKYNILGSFHVSFFFFSFFAWTHSFISTNQTCKVCHLTVTIKLRCGRNRLMMWQEQIATHTAEEKHAIKPVVSRSFLWRWFCKCPEDSVPLWTGG